MERQKNKPDEARIKFWSDQVFNLRLRQDSLLTTIKQSNPDYFRLKYDYSTISADSALASLNSDQAIIEYHIADSLVFGFILTDNKISVKKMCAKSDLAARTDSLQKYFLRKDFFNAGQDEFNAITSLSHELYEILIKPFELEISGKRLIIVPDGELGYLSFDLLLKEKPDFNGLHYKDLQWLIRSNPISYSSSSTIFFEQMKSKAGKVRANILAFAPSYNYNASERNSGNSDSSLQNLMPMVGTKEEINSISDLFKTRRFFDNQATETNFKEIAGKYSILHLAMHTIIDDQNPLYSRLVFTMPEKNSADDGYLNTYELFGLPLAGQLAVLSACNTGSGKLERGEGIISLARGFFYAGIPSVVMTLWEVEDHSSADLVALFYKNLRAGFATDIALQNAKIEFLETAGQLQSHPYFWAGYVNIGKTMPISFQPAQNTIVMLIVSIISAILIIYFFINNRVFFIKKRH
jgi:CHAT domain-containing protein